MKRYNPTEIEKKWQESWRSSKAYEVRDDDPRPKYYHLVEFPYPSGAGLHVGHTRPYISFDIMSRWRRMTGQNVLFPIGWDSFGLPAEQYAIKTGVHPSETTASNINTFRNQAQKLGLSFDWSREFSTADPSYYKWTQWIFLQLFSHDLAYQAETMVWWCEGLKSVLADEEVIDGRSERGDFPCVRQPLRQWMLAITKYADRLYDDLEDLDYIEPVKVQQRNWIGRSKGAEVKFSLTADSKMVIEVFTTRADTLFGATYLVLAPENPLVPKITTNVQKTEVEKYIGLTSSKSELTRQEEVKNKTGVFTGAYAINPLNSKKIPIWISDYVLMSYGTGAIMAVPAHDERDNAFAKKFDLPIINVVNPVAIRADSVDAKKFLKKDKIVAVVVDDKNQIMTINWGPKLGGRLLIGGGVEPNETIEQTAKREVKEETGYSDLEVIARGEEEFNYKYYAFSKQRHYEVNCKFVYLRLKSDKRVDQQLDQSEKGNFKVEWVSMEKADREIDEPLHRYAFDKFILGKCFTGEGVMTNSGKYDGITSSIAREEIVKDLEVQKQAREVTNYKMRDWVFSRQRYWGEPFPIVWVSEEDAKAASGDVVKWLPKNPVNKMAAGKNLVAMPILPKFLPVELPMVKDFEPKGLGKGPLADSSEWVDVWYNLETSETKSRTEEKPTGKLWVEAERETDTMPNWAGSSWYFLRYLDPNNEKELASKVNIEKWMAVDWYNGGMEHTTLHLLYSRFWHKFLFDIGVVNTSEPYKKRTSHGLVLAEDSRKMSKSWGNVVDPLEVVGDYGADTLRLYIAFIGPFEQSVSWNINGVAGCRRFIERFWTIAQEFKDSSSAIDESAILKNKQLAQVVAKVNQRISTDIPKMGFNTAVAGLMEAINSLYKLRETLPFKDFSGDWSATFRELITLSAPFIPHFCEELWHDFGFSGNVIDVVWPMWDEKALLSDKAILAIQVNGKLRGEIEVDVDSEEASVAEKIKHDPKIAELLSGKEIRRTIFIPNKLINLVVSDKTA